MYASETKQSSIRVPYRLTLNWEAIQQGYPEEDVYLVALTDREIVTLTTLARAIVPWYWLWNIDKNDVMARAEVIDLAERIEENLIMTTRLSDLVKVNMMIVAALTGQAINDLEDVPESVDYSDIGVSPKLQVIADAIAESGIDEENIDDLEEIWDNVSTVLGAVAVLA